MKISIITITLNDLNGLIKTFDSLKMQSNQDFEWIIKDGVSNDGTLNYYNSTIVNSSLNVRMVQESDSSIYDAMNQSVKYACGEYYLFLNAGDCLASYDTISVLLDTINLTPRRYSIIYGDSIDVTENGISIYKKSRDYSYLKHSLPTSHQAIFYNSTIFEKFKYPLKYKIAADYAFTARIFIDFNADYLRLNFPICRFQLGGISQLNRDILLKEGYEIHRTIIGDNICIATLKYIFTYIVCLFFDNSPKIYLLFRRLIEKI